MESWRKVWREAVDPSLTLEQLQILHKALCEDDPALIQGATTQPPPLQCVQDWPCEGGCVLGFLGWKTSEHGTVGESEEFFATKCFEIDQRLGEPAGVRWLLNWWDETPRQEVFDLLLGEVEQSILLRSSNLLR